MKGPVSSGYPAPMKVAMLTSREVTDARVKLEGKEELNILHLGKSVGAMESFFMR